MFMDRMDEATLEGILKGTSGKASKKAEQDDLEILMKKLYRHPEDGRVGFPGENFWANLCAAGALVKYDTKRQMVGASGTLLPLFLDIREKFMALENATPFMPTNPTEAKQLAKAEMDAGIWKRDLRCGRNATGQAVPVLRPMFPAGWAISLTMDIDDDEISLNKIEALFKFGGAKGLGAFRPGKSRTGYFGRYAVDKWVVLKNDEKTKVSAEKQLEELLAKELAGGATGNGKQQLVTA